MNETQLRNVWQNRQRSDHIAPLYEPLERLMTDRLARQVRQLGRLADAWEAAVPPELLCQTTLVSFRRGTLTVAVPSAAHRFRLEMLLRGGLREALRAAVPAAALSRVRVVPGGFDPPAGDPVQA